MGITLLMFLIFAFIPYYQARKRIKELEHWTRGDLNAAVPVLRFETWLDLQKSPVTRIMMGLMLLVGIVQLVPGTSMEFAGLYKDRFMAGEWWRLFTAPFLHANLIHFLMNLSALAYLGKRLEVFARWPHLPLVFLLSCVVAGEASARFVAAPSVGASGGLMGWLGFLLVFESTHTTLVPRSCRRRLVAGLVLTVAIGLVGYQYIDNAAHVGGLLCGMFYAAAVFPKSSTSHRPKSHWVDLIAGSAALLGCTAAAILTVWLIW
jgi:membrane associated rhomboid family serine protease